MAHAQGGSVPHEVELKYRVADPAALRAWLADGWPEVLDWATLGEPRTKAVEDRYFDTTRDVLRHHGFGARLRRVGGRYLVTVKSLSPDELGWLGHYRVLKVLGAPAAPERENA